MDFAGELLERIMKAKNVVILTGAGISAESGISTFRDKDGLWSQFNPKELASIDGFMENSERVWQWYQYRRQVLSSAEPNEGHYAIARMQNLFDRFTLITQNVDRLHQRAGSKDVIELHGNILENRCFSCNTAYTKEIDINDKQMPRCESCGGKIRPCVVWFGEALPQDAINRAEIESMQADLYFSIGTSSEVFPAANLPVIAKDYGAYLVEINPNRTSITQYADIHIPDKAAIVLPLIHGIMKNLDDMKRQ